jgi:hypothetical protein
MKYHQMRRNAALCNASDHVREKMQNEANVNLGDFGKQERDYSASHRPQRQNAKRTQGTF